MLRLTEVCARYGQMRILKGVNLEVREGELMCLLGSNACGKSTTMKAILGLVRPYQGQIEFEGKRIDGLVTAAA